MRVQGKDNRFTGVFDWRLQEWFWFFCNCYWPTTIFTKQKNTSTPGASWMPNTCRHVRVLPAPLGPCSQSTCPSFTASVNSGLAKVPRIPNYEKIRKNTADKISWHVRCQLVARVPSQKKKKKHQLKTDKKSQLNNFQQQTAAAVSSTTIATSNRTYSH